MQKLIVLIFIDWFSPGYKAGGPVSSNINLINHLKSDFHFKVITRNTEYMETIPYDGIVSNTWVQMEGFEGYYISQQRLSASSIRRIIKTIKADVVYVNGIYSVYFSILPLFFAKLYKKKVIVSARGMLSPHALAVKSYKKNLFLRIFKLAGLYRNISFHATNEEEKGYIQQLLGRHTKVLVAPNLPKKISPKAESVAKSSEILHLIYIGRIAPEKNTLFALQVLSGLRNLAAKITFSIYGSVYNKAYWEQCKKLIEELPDNVNVIYYGSIEPAFIPEVLGKSHFLLQPSLGENYGHTIAESFQNAVPVIISERTPWLNLEEKGVGWDIPLDQPEQFVKVLEHCASMGQEEYDAMSRKAFEYAKQVTEDPEVIEANRRLFE